MNFMLPSTAAQDPHGPLDRAEPTAAQRMQAQFRFDRVTTDPMGQQAQAFERDLLAEMKSAIGPEPDEPTPSHRVPSGQSAYLADRKRTIEQIAELRAFDPDFSNLPATEAEFEAEVLRRRRAEVGELTDLLDAAPVGGWAPELVGSLGAGLRDEWTLLTLPLGAAGRLRVLTTALIEGGAGAAGEALSLPDQYRTARELGTPAPNAPLQIGAAALVAGGIGAGVAGAGRYLQYRRVGDAVSAVQRPDHVSPLSFGDALDGAEAELNRKRSAGGLDTGQPEQSSARASGILPPITADAPANWRAIRGGIFAGESQGDFDALFGFSNRAGGAFENVRITDMTVDEAIAFSSPRGPYASWVKGKIGRVATPMGAYQIVGTTLRAAKRGLGLTGKERMTPALQERLGQYIYRTQGTGAWVGYRGPRSGYVPPEYGDAPAGSSFSGYSTSRPYTAMGEVNVGDDLRVEVEYQVVDASDLRQATGSLQPRDRARAASDAWVSDTAARLDPAQLMDSPWADRGAPLVGPDGVIESGNGRVRAIERAYEQGSDRAEAYRRQIELRTGSEIPEEIERPVLIARRTSELDDETRRRVVVEAQDSGVARMNATERAQVGREALGDDLLQRLDPDAKLTSAENRNFARAFSGHFPRSERNAFIDDAGGLSIDGVRQMQDSLFARAYDAPDILARYVETEPGELRTILDALAAAAPRMAQLRAAIEAGRVRPEMDITPFVLDASRLILGARELAAAEGSKVAEVIEDLLGAVDLLDGSAVAPLTAALVRRMMPGGRAAPAKQITDFLNRYAEEAMKAGRTGDILDPSGPLDVLKAVDRDAFGDLTETGRAGHVEPEPVEVQPVAQEAGFDRGAESTGARIGDAQGEAELREIAEARGGERSAEIEDLRAFGDVEVVQPDGSTVTVREVLEDLDADGDLEAVLDACPTGRAV